MELYVCVCGSVSVDLMADVCVEVLSWNRGRKEAVL